jgi:hypothetical protein
MIADNVVEEGWFHSSLRAKRSNPETVQKGLDCFVAALLAMTAIQGATTA